MLSLIFPHTEYDESYQKIQGEVKKEGLLNVEGLTPVATCRETDAMILRNRRILLISIAVVIMTDIWIERYTLLYHYYLWRLNNTVDGSEIMDLGDRIQALGPHVVSLLVLMKMLERPQKAEVRQPLL